MRGRPPKPTEQKRREGNAGKRKLPTTARASRVAGVGDLGPDWAAPKSLGADGRSLWDYLVPKLHAARWIDLVDLPMLRQMCEQHDIAEAARRVIVDLGVLTMGSRKSWVENPAIATQQKATMIVLRIAEQFGMTASARARLDVIKGGLADPQGELERQIGASPLLRVVKGGRKSA